MWRGHFLAAVLLMLAGSALMSAAARARQPVRRPRTTTLVNDPQHPFSAAALARMQRWVDRSYLPVAPGQITVSRGVPDVISEGLAGDHLVALNYANRFALMHELGHESQMFVGPGSSTVNSTTGNYEHPGEGWSDAKIAALAKALHRPVSSWSTGQRPLMELAADAYATVAMNPHWRRWWGHPGSAKRGRVSWVSTATPYDFRANRQDFRQIRAILSR